MAKESPSKIPFRRVVPSGYQEAVLELQGTSPLLMNSGETDRESEQYRAYFTLGQKRSKTLDDDARLRELEWSLALYLDAEIGPYIPGKNVKEMLRAASTKWKRGEDVKRSLVVIENRIPLVYEGPRDEVSLWEQGYRYTTMVANAGMNRGRVIRCRPCFDAWSLTVNIAYDPEDLDFGFLEMAVERAQKFGLGDYRPEFGSFSATLTLGATHKARSNGKATKAKDLRAIAAHEAHKKQVLVS